MCSFFCSPKNTIYALSFEEQFAAELAKYNSISRNYIVDLFLFNKQIGSVSITKKGKNITFAKPKRVTGLIINLKNPTQFEALLAVPFSSNTDKICRKRKKKNNVVF